MPALVRARDKARDPGERGRGVGKHAEIQIGEGGDLREHLRHGIRIDRVQVEARRDRHGALEDRQRLGTNGARRRQPVRRGGPLGIRAEVDDRADRALGDRLLADVGDLHERIRTVEDARPRGAAGGERGAAGIARVAGSVDQSAHGSPSQWILPRAYRPRADPHTGGSAHGTGRVGWSAALRGSREDSPSGLWRTLGKRVGCKPSGVRIPHPPQNVRTKRCPARGGASFVFRRGVAGRREIMMQRKIVCLVTL